MSLPLWERGLKFYTKEKNKLNACVAPLVGAWIEISIAKRPYSAIIVAPLVGAWIEILYVAITSTAKKVAPLVGAWIEITSHIRPKTFDVVAPLVGAWIEMEKQRTILKATMSLPLWERGLKFDSKMFNETSGSRSPCGSVD